MLPVIPTDHHFPVLTGPTLRVPLIGRWKPDVVHPTAEFLYDDDYHYRGGAGDLVMWWDDPFGRTHRANVHLHAVLYAMDTISVTVDGPVWGWHPPRQPLGYPIGDVDPWLE